MSVYDLQSSYYAKINEIKDISSIKIYDMINSKNTNSYSGVLGLLVFYGNGEYLNYTELESEFLYFFETVRRVYESEKNNRHIYIDEQTEYFLNSLNPSFVVNDIKSKVGKIGTFNKKIYYKINEVKSNYKIIEYVIENFLSFLGRNVDVTLVKGMGANFTLKVYENNCLKNLSFKYISKNEISSTCVFRGLINDYKELYVDIDYSEGLEIQFYDYDKSIVGVQRFDKDTKSLVTLMYINGECKLRKYDTIQSFGENLPYLTEEENTYDKYVLPWGDILVVNQTNKDNEVLLKDRKDIDLTNDGIIVTNLDDKVLKYNERVNSLIYVTNVNGEHIRVIRQNEVIKSLFSPTLYKLSKISLKTCVEASVTNYYMVGNYVIKETTFIPSLLGSGVYKSELEGKSFYKVYQMLNNEVKEEYSIIKEGVQGYQLLDENELKLILGRGVK